MSFGHLPLRASSLADPPAPVRILSTDAMFVEVFGLMIIVHLFTRRRPVPDLAGRAPQADVARWEMLLTIGYGLLAMLGGLPSVMLSAGMRSASTWTAW
ncbi:MAG: hypothetical protein J2P23_13895 [Microlunatus sp.]|nr:hypothetical protein [Microlunatus sp.]